MAFRVILSDRKEVSDREIRSHLSSLQFESNILVDTLTYVECFENWIGISVAINVPIIPYLIFIDVCFIFCKANGKAAPAREDNLWTIIVKFVAK